MPTDHEIAMAAVLAERKRRKAHEAAMRAVEEARAKRALSAAKPAIPARQPVMSNLGAYLRGLTPYISTATPFIPPVKVITTTTAMAGKPQQAKTETRIKGIGKEELSPSEYVGRVLAKSKFASPQPEPNVNWRAFQQGILNAIPIPKEWIGREAMPEETAQHPTLTVAGRIAGEAAQMIPALRGIGTIPAVTGLGTRVAAKQGSKRILAQAALEAGEMGTYGTVKGALEGVSEGQPAGEIPGRAALSGLEWAATGAVFGAGRGIVQNSLAYIKAARGTKDAVQAIKNARAYLGVGEKATDTEIKKAGRQIMASVHPDVMGPQSTEASKITNAAVKEAINVIKGGNVTPGF